MNRVKLFLPAVITFFIISFFITFNRISYSNQDSQKLLETEKNTIEVVKNNVDSVVFVSNIQRVSRGFLDLEGQEVPTGAGSGFVWDEQGHIVTNYHVIQGGGKFSISFNRDKTQYEAVLVGDEAYKDIAVLKLVKPPKKLHPIKVGSSKNLLVGQKTIAIGNPYGLDHTVTQGIVSALDRSIKGVTGISINDMIQTDAAINPGNSGGPLLNSNGELIGMNTVIYSTSGGSAGVGFSVPVDTINNIVPQLIKHGQVIRPKLGIAMKFNEQIKYRYGIKKGVVIWSIAEGGPIAKAGLKGLTQDNNSIYIGDILLKIGDVEVNNYEDIYHALDKFKIGDTANITYLRDGKTKETTIKFIQID
ncbi:MAG: hypothetical protein A2202_03000 [Bdellovibrionales bacterium RIFOXYA1_FULL_36_14]|nr:MAG: hypothetical protein A2202_03000 [Bdellovibrionales bacterium RIFOXYA1_FULL_36_14]